MTIRESLAVKFEQHLLWRFSVCSLFSSDIWWWIPHCRCLCLLDRRVDVSIVTDDAVAVPSSASIHYHINQQAYCRHQIFICWILNNVASVPRALVYVAHEMRRVTWPFVSLFSQKWPRCLDQLDPKWPRPNTIYSLCQRSMTTRKFTNSRGEYIVAEQGYLTSILLSTS